MRGLHKAQWASCALSLIPPTSVLSIECLIACVWCLSSIMLTRLRRQRHCNLNDLPLDIILLVMRHMSSSPRRSLAKCDTTLSNAYTVFFHKSLAHMRQSACFRDDIMGICPRCKRHAAYWSAPYYRGGTKRICQACCYDYVVGL